MGARLRAMIDDGPLPFHQAASILRQLGSALEAAHNKGVIHRDLKPENIMLQQLGDGSHITKLIDFGVARVEDSSVSSDTAVIGLAGTPSYMAPEHVSGRPVPASDIFSLGVIAYEMLTGQRPFTAKQPYALRQQQKQGIARGAIRSLRPETPVEAENAVREALDFDSARRPQNVRLLCDTIGLSLEAHACSGCCAAHAPAVAQSRGGRNCGDSGRRNRVLVVFTRPCSTRLRKASRVNEWSIGSYGEWLLAS